MNWTVYLLQAAVLLLIFTAAVVPGLTRDPVSFVSSFPPDIQAVYYRTQGIPRPKAPFTRAELIRKLMVLLLSLFPLGWLAKLCGAESFAGSFWMILSDFVIIAGFDTFLLDWVFFPRVRCWRLPGTENMDQAYRQKWFHLKGVLLMTPVFLLYALAAAAIRVWLF